MRAIGAHGEAMSVAWPLPQFVVAGVWKSGSTAVWSALGQHPDLQTSRAKEPRYFDLHFLDGCRFYESQFDRRRAGVRGEGSVSYFVSPEAAIRIAEVIPSVRLLFVLRDPVARALSHYHWSSALGKTSRNLDQLLAAGKTAPEIWPSCYGTHLRRFFGLFDRSQIHVVIFERFRDSAVAELRQIEQFLGVSPFCYDLSNLVRNASVAARSTRLARLLEVSRQALRVAGAGSVDHPWVTRVDRAVRFVAEKNRVGYRYASPTDGQVRRLRAVLGDEIAEAELLLGHPVPEWDAHSRYSME